jgi:RNA polymerase sigma-70 factor (ECF subfamily)
MNGGIQALAPSGDKAIRALREREQEAAKFHVEQLAREHARMVFRIAYSALRHQQDAEDVTQEVFVRVLRYAHRLAQVEDEKSWVARIAWRVTLERLKGRNREALEDAGEHVAQLRDLGRSAEEIAAGAQMQRMLEAMIATLPRRLRDVMLLSTVQEMNSAEISAVLGIPEGSVRRRLMRARELLKQKLTAVLEKR